MNRCRTESQGGKKTRQHAYRKALTLVCTVRGWLGKHEERRTTGPTCVCTMLQSFSYIDECVTIERAR